MNRLKTGKIARIAVLAAVLGVFFLPGVTRGQTTDQDTGGATAVPTAVREDLDDDDDGFDWGWLGLLGLIGLAGLKRRDDHDRTHGTTRT